MFRNYLYRTIIWYGLCDVSSIKNALFCNILLPIVCCRNIRTVNLCRDGTDAVSLIIGVSYCAVIVCCLLFKSAVFIIRVAYYTLCIRYWDNSSEGIIIIQCASVAVGSSYDSPVFNYSHSTSRWENCLKVLLITASMVVDILITLIIIQFWLST